MRLAFSMRYEAFHVVEEMTQTADPDAMADLADSWLEQRPAGALMALIHAWFGELQRGLADGDVDWAMAWAVVGDRLIVPVAPAAPFRKRLADHFDDAGDVDRALRIHNGLLAENPDDGERLVAVAKALSRTDRADEAIALLRSRLSDPPIAA